MLVRKTIPAPQKPKLKKPKNKVLPNNGAFSSELKNIQLCNGADRSTPEPQIKGCTALIESGEETSLVLAVAYTNRGNAYAAKGDYDLAISDYDAAIKLNPAFAKPFNNRGVALQKKGEYDRAIKDFDEAIKLQPDYARAFANRAETYQKRHDYQRAARDYDEATRLAPTLEAVWNGRCWARAILGELQAALEDCNKALALTTLRPSTLAGLFISRWASLIQPSRIIVPQSASSQKWPARFTGEDLHESKRVMQLVATLISLRQRSWSRRSLTIFQITAFADDSSFQGPRKPEGYGAKRGPGNSHGGMSALGQKQTCAVH